MTSPVVKARTPTGRGRSPAGSATTSSESAGAKTAANGHNSSFGNAPGGALGDRAESAVRVVVRVRPQNKKEIEAGGTVCVAFPSEVRGARGAREGDGSEGFGDLNGIGILSCVCCDFLEKQERYSPRCALYVEYLMCALISIIFTTIVIVLVLYYFVQVRVIAYYTGILIPVCMRMVSHEYNLICRSVCTTSISDPKCTCS